ncbi:hypothetical protein SAMN05444159_3508 [Bradyrhizobium lablabi]|uniref:Uncharacterized protein n=1 Tax=Bradyrhizobium lablabi TaxID=722472 RepID=A0A1M6T9J1_9BRAD|nr:hypothetical protein [Bradyrhizobium lablabi]SHK53408.1 hypothetical protein SAMN05444159_3508 [Bradyrhizobium lablabi]
MNNAMEPSFGASEQAVLDEIGHRLRARGWAAHVTVARLLRDWQKLSGSVDRYKMTIDDYTNDLTARDALEIVLAECQEPLRAKLRLPIEGADKEFLARTQEDVGHTLERYFQISQSSGWWWKRRPVTGPLAEFLTRQG